ncbi:MAG TPA: hypothetical protein GX503_01345 [Clostridiales bacterium]|nr:hypothetical protein [Clostridiales bacterium]
MKKIVAFIMLLCLLFTNFSFALDLNATVHYLAKQELDAWGILALYSNSSNIENRSLEKINSSKITTDYESYIMGAISLGLDVSEYAAQITAAQQENGKFADLIHAEGNDLVNSHIWGIISLYVSDHETYNKELALAWLKSQQNEDGGFPVFTGLTVSDPDLTAMGIVAYHILGLDENSPEIQKAFAFIEKSLQKQESCETLSWYILAKKKLGLPVSESLYKNLLSYQLNDGSFKHLKESKNGNYIATWHALLALSDCQNEISIFDQLHNKSKQRHEQKENENHKI